MTNVVSFREAATRRQRREDARREQAFIEACERELDEGRVGTIGELIDRAQARVDRERSR